MDKPTVGQTVFSLNVGNAARNCEQVLTPMIVTKVGRLYFVVGDSYHPNRFYISGWAHKQDNPTMKLFATEQAWHDEKEALALGHRVAFALHYGSRAARYPLADLRTIVAIVDRFEKKGS